MQPTNQLLGVQFQAGIRLVTNAVSHETLLISDFLSHHNKIQLCPYSIILHANISIQIFNIECTVRIKVNAKNK